MAPGKPNAHFSFRRATSEGASRAMSAGWKRCCEGSTPHPFQCGLFSGSAKAAAPSFGHAPAAVSCALASSEPQKKTISKNPKIARAGRLQKVIAGRLGRAGFLASESFASSVVIGRCERSFLSSLLMPRPCQGFPARVERFLSTVFRFRRVGMPEDRAPRNSGAQGQESGPWGREMKSGSDSPGGGVGWGRRQRAPRGKEPRHHHLMSARARPAKSVTTPKC